MQQGDLASAVRQAQDRPDVAAAVAELYESVEAEIARRRPLCVVSGRCCKFDEYGHNLFVTTMELAAFMGDYKRTSITPRPAEGGCPFQQSRLCGVHRFRPMGCRLFFCDASSTQWQHDQYEQFHARLKRLHESLEVPYVYMEWRAALGLLGIK